MINHLQDCADDYATLDRVYLPLDWMAAETASIEDLTAPRATPGLRRVMDLCINGVRGLLSTSRELPHALSSRRLALESAVIIRIAERLTEELARRDPIAERVELTKPQFLTCGIGGIWTGLFGRPPSKNG